MILKLSIPGKPIAWNNALIRVRGKPFLSPEARSWKRSAGLLAVSARPSGWPLNASYAVTIDSWFANARADCDGPIKLVLDSLNGIAWTDDAQVLRVVARKYIDRERPRVEVIVEVLG